MFRLCLVCVRCMWFRLRFRAGYVYVSAMFGVCVCFGFGSVRCRIMLCFGFG